MGKKTQPKSKVVETTAKLTAASLSIAGASSSLGVAAGVAGMVGGVAGAANAVYRAWQAAQDEKIRRLLLEAYFENAADEGFAADITAKLQNPRVRRVFMESVRTALESVADEVLPSIAALMRDYERAGKEPDASFRGLCRVLQELSAEEYASMQGLFRRAAGTDLEQLGCREVSFVRAIDSAAGTEEVLAAGVYADGRLELVHALECDPRHFPRLSHLMYLHNIGNKLGDRSVSLGGKDTKTSYASAQPPSGGWRVSSLSRI